MDIATIGLKADSSDLTRAEKAMGGVQRQAKKTETATERMEREFQRTSGTLQAFRGYAVAAVTALGGFAVARTIVQDMAAFERGLIGVGKTTGIAGDELDALGQRIRDISGTVPVATTELLALGQSAGQLGVKGADNIARFTETIGKLGTASDLAGEQAATAFARILTVTGTPISEVDRLGASIVALGNNFAATESEISSAATRVAQSTSQFGVAADEVLGIGTALRAIGVEAEAGGTQIGLAFQSINDALRSGGEEMRALEQITGETGASLRQSFFGGESAEVFADFVSGLGRIQQAGGDVASVLEEFDLNGVRAVQVLGTLATRSAVLQSALRQARTGYEENIALNEEAATAAESFSSQLQLLKNDFFAITSGGDVGALTQAVKDLREVITDPSFQQGFQAFINGGVQLVSWAGQAAALVDDLGVAIGRLSVNFDELGAGGLAATFWTTGLPGVIYQLNRLSEMTPAFEQIENITSGIQSGDYDPVIAALGSVHGLIQDTGRATDNYVESAASAGEVTIPLRRGLNATAEATQEAFTETEKLSDSERALREELALLNRQFELMNGGMSASEAQIQAQREALDGTALAVFNVEQRINDLTESRARLDEMTRAAADLRAEMEAASRVRIDQLMQNNIGLFSDQTASQREFQDRNAQLLELHARQHELVDSSEELQAAQEALREEFENREMVESFTELQDVMLAIEDDWSRAAAQILRGLENVSDETKRSTLGFAQMAQGAAGFFSEGTAGYEVMQKASEVFYAAEIAQAANAFALKQNWITTETALVTAQAGIKAAAEGVAAAASSMVGLPFPANLAALSATVAALAAIGVNISGGGGGGGGPAASLSASGTVLGDPSADSESIANSISALEDIASEELQYSSRMASSLANIEQALAGLGAQIARVSGLDEVRINSGSLSDLLSGGSVSGDIDLVDQFFSGGPQAVIDAMANVEAATPGIERQIQQAVGEMIDTAVTGFEALGRDGASAMEQALQATLPDLSIDANLPADELSERLSSFFSSISDSLVMVLDNGLVEDYQRLGEGLLETLTRIVSGMETAQAGLDRIGLSLGENLKPEATVDLTNALIEAAGGTSEFQNATENFVDSFLSETQQLDVATREATQALANIGMELPATRDGFRDLVQGFEVTDQASARVLSTLLNLAPAMDELYSASEEIQEEAMDLRIRLLEAQGEASAALELERQRELEGVAEVNREMLRQVYAAEDAARAEEELRRQREEAARQAAEIADQRQRLEIELLRTMGHEEEALRLERERQLASMPAQLHALQRQIWAEQELAAERERQAQIAQQSTELLRAFDVVPSAFQETLDQLGLMQSQLPRTAEAMGDFLMTLTEAERAALQPFVSDLQALTQQQTSTPRSYTPTTTVSDGISEAEDALRQAFNAEQSELNQTISQFERLGSALGDFSDELSDLIATTVPGVSRVSSLRSEFDSLMGRGLSGDTAALDALPGAGRSLVDEIERTATSRIDLIRQVSAVQREILAAEEAAGAQKSLAEQQLDEMRSQVSALIDINDSVLSVEEAIRDLTGGGYANGGIATGPESGYLTALHGDEAVIPLQGGGVPVYMRGGDKDNRMARIEQLLERMHETDEEGYRAIAKHVSKTAKNTERTADIQEVWDADGLPAERTS